MLHSFLFQPVLFVFLLWVLLSNAVKQSHAQSDWSQLSQIASASKYRPITTEDVAQARAVVQQRYQELVWQIDQGGLHAADWQMFLRDNSIAPSLESHDELSRTIDLLGQDISGIDWEPLQAYRRSLAEYKAWHELLNSSTLVDEFESRLRLMSQALEEFAAKPSAALQARIVQDAEWFEQRYQLVELVDALHQRSKWNNIDVQISRELLAAYVSDDFVKHRPVRDCILGTAISGQSVASGTAHLEIAADPSRIHLTIVVNTCAHSDTIGVNGPVHIFSDGITSISTRKSILFDGNTVTSLPAYSRATTNSTTKGLATKFSGGLDRLVKRIATKQISKKKSQGDAIAASHAARDTNEATDLEVDTLVRDGNALYYAEIRRPQTIRGIFPEHHDLSSEPTGVRFATLMAGVSQFGAPFQTDFMLPASDIRAHIHQSCVNNLLANYFAGKTYALQDLHAMIDEFRTSSGLDDGSSPSEPASSGAAQRQISVSLDAAAPIEALFEDGGIVLTIRANQIQIDNQVYAAMNISLRFALESADHQWFLVFDGEPVIIPARLVDAPGKLSGPEIAVRRILRNTIVREMPTSTEISSVPLDRDGKSIGALYPNSIQSGLGWLAIAADYAH